MTRHVTPLLLVCSLAFPTAFGQASFESLEALRGSVPSPAFIEGADMNGDGLMDVVMGSAELASGESTPGEFAVSIALGESGGTYAPCQSVGSLSGPIRAMDIGDIDGDQVPDLVVSAFADDDGASASGAVYVLLKKRA